jgi:hypothetical protein
VSEEYADPAGESEMRRRAAWLLGMLVLVAVLVVALMVFFLKGGGHGAAAPTGPPLPTGPVTTGNHHPSSQSPGAPTSSSRSRSSSPPVSRPHTVHCPTSQTCIAQGDAGGLLAAINAYRQQNGQSAVAGSVSNAAQTCAVTNGDQCTGNWAESEVPAPNGKPSGKEALQKVIPLSHDLLAPNLTGVEVGWAYDPTAQLCYFAVITDA